MFYDLGLEAVQKQKICSTVIAVERLEMDFSMLEQPDTYEDLKFESNEANKKFNIHIFFYLIGPFLSFRICYDAYRVA